MDPLCRRNFLASIGLAAVLPGRLHAAMRGEPDKFEFLNDREGAEARAWVALQNGKTSAALESKGSFEQALATLKGLRSKKGDAAGGSPFLWLDHDWIYDVRTDAQNQRGVFRRIRLEHFLASKQDWQALLDVDALSRSENAQWIITSISFSPNGKRCILNLSVRGSSRQVCREFDLMERMFVADGFNLNAATPADQIVWKNEESVFVITDFGPGSVNDRGSPLVVKEWRRGASLKSAKTVFQGEGSDSLVSLDSFANETETVHIARQTVDNSYIWLRVNLDSNVDKLWGFLGSSYPILYDGYYIIALREALHLEAGSWLPGTVIAISASEIGNETPPISVVHRGDDSIFTFPCATSAGLLYLATDGLESRLWRFRREGASWSASPMALPAHGMIRPALGSLQSNIALVRYESFLHPPSLYSVDVRGNEASVVSSAPEGFPAADLLVEVLEAASYDGMKVPYTVVRPKDLSETGQAPTLLMAYGASAGTNLPVYDPSLGALWLSRGGVYVVAHVRGGGARGAAWHVTGVQRQHTYDDTACVAEDLIRRGITSPRHLSFIGWSNGGLLGGVMLTQRPDLFCGVVLKAALLDQFRLDDAAGGAATWSREFGSAEDPSVRAFLRRSSPYQNIPANRRLPPPLILTSTMDETVHPAQSRRFAAKMEAMSKDFYFFETSEGGHGLASTPDQHDRVDALIYTYLWERVKACALD